MPVVLANARLLLACQRPPRSASTATTTTTPRALFHPHAPRRAFIPVHPAHRRQYHHLSRSAPSHCLSQRIAGWLRRGKPPVSPAAGSLPSPPHPSKRVDGFFFTCTRTSLKHGVRLGDRPYSSLSSTPTDEGSDVRTPPPGPSLKGKISFPALDTVTLALPLNGPEQFTQFSFRSHVPLGVILKQITDEVDWVKDAAVYDFDAAGVIGPRWARSSLLDDVLREASRGARKGFVVVVNGQHHVTVDLPPFEERMRPLIEDLARRESEFLAMRKIKKECDAIATKSTKRLSYAGLGFLIGQWAFLARLTYWEFSWDVMEPICYFITSGNAIIGYIFYIFFKKEFTYENMHSVNLTKQQLLLYNRKNLDPARYYDLKAEVLRTKEQLQKVKNEYI